MEENDVQEEIKDERFINLAIGIVIVGILIFIVYIANFSSGNVSDESSDWGAIGDYFNGLLSPFIGFVTIVLIFKTYKLQRKELRATHNALNDQIKQTKDAAKREMFWRSAEKVYSEIEIIFKEDCQSFDAILLQINEVPTEKALKQLVKFHIPLISELNTYLSEIDKLTDGNSMSTDYFRRRITSRYKQYVEDCPELNIELYEVIR